MEQCKIDLFVAQNSSKLPADKMVLVVEKLKTMSDERFSMLQSKSLTSPVVVWVVSFFFGALGIDRFIVGSVGAGVVKLLTGGGFGLWWFIDLFLIGKAAKENNYKKLSLYLM